jgi:hypothetical protein
MERAKLNYFLDAGMLIVFIAVAATGIIKMPVVARGLGGYGSLPMDTITPLHDISGVLLVVFVLLHLALHWGWIVGMTKALFSKKQN